MMFPMKEIWFAAIMSVFVGIHGQDPTVTVPTTDSPANISENTVFVMFPENSRINKILKLLITSKTNSRVHVFSDTPAYEKDVHVNNGGIREDIPAVSQLDRGAIERKAIEITSDTDVSVFGVSHLDCCSTDGFFALPYKSLGTKYKTISYHYPQNSFLSVLAVHDNTEVDVTFNTTGKVNWEGNNIESGATVKLNMSRLSTVQILHTRDISGTTVESNKPIAVMSGNTCASVLGGACNHLVEYLPPVSNFGKTFVIPTIKTASRMVIRVVPSEYNSTVTIYDYRGPHQYPLNVTFEIELLAATLYLVKCSSPCLVVQFSVFTQRHPVPFMTLVPALEQYDSSYKFMTPSVNDFNNYITIVTQNKHADDVMFDDVPITRQRFVEKHLLSADDKYWVSLSLFIQPGLHTLRHSNVNIGFGAIGYGFKPYDAYAFPLGMKFP